MDMGFIFQIMSGNIEQNILMALQLKKQTDVAIT